MSTVTHEVVISEDALDLLSCFYNGVDKIVYELALVAARERLQVKEGEFVEIEQQDVESAGDALLLHLRELDTKNAFTALLHGSKSCFDAKTKKRIR
jgi:hypothetical protein